MPYRSRDRNACAIVAWFVAALFAFLVAVGPDCAAQQRVQGQGGGSRFESLSSDPEFLLFSLSLGDVTLDEAFPGFLDGGAIVLPLGLLSELLEFAITVDAQAGRADGWFIRDNRLFSLNASRGEVVIDGKRRSFDPGLLLREPDDIYVDTRLLTRWFPIDLRVDMPNLRLRVSSREPLPMKERLEREVRRSALQSSRFVPPSYDRIPVPRRIVSIPTVDLSSEYSTDWTPGESSDRQLQYNLLATNDLLYMNSEVFLGGFAADYLTDARIRLDRIEPEGYDLWRVPVRSASLGDISSPSVPLIASPSLGRGGLLSNQRVDQPDEFDRITLVGELPLGWEVELLRNGILIDFRQSRADGRYEFADVQLVFGINVLRLNFFGPQGQRREDVRQIHVGTDQLRPGEWTYKVSLNEHNERVFSGVGNSSADPALRGRARRLFSGTMGVNRNLTIGANVASLPVEDDRTHYFGANALWSYGGALWRIDAVNQLERGWATRLSAQGTYAGFSLFGEHNVFNDYFSERAKGAEGNFFTSKSKLRAEGGVLLPWIRHQIVVSLEGNREERESGAKITNVTNRISGGLFRATVSNNIGWTLNEANEETDEILNGQLLIGGRIRPLQLRGEINYLALPEGELSSGQVTVEWPVSQQITGRGSVQHRLIPEPTTSYTAGYNVRLGIGFIGLNLQYVDSGTLNGLLTYSASIGPEPRKRRPWIDSVQRAGSGSFRGRAYLDQNANGVFDEGDSPMEGVRFRINSIPSRAATDAAGDAFLKGLPVYRLTNVTVDTQSLDDPFLTPLKPGVALVARPGSFAEHEFAIVTTGEVDGTVFRVFGDSASPVSGAIVQLVDERGNIVREVRSAFDGFYLLDFVPPGKYEVRIAPEQQERLELRTAPQQVEITGEGTVAAGTDFVLVSAGAANVVKPGDADSGLRRPSQSTLPGGSN